MTNIELLGTARLRLAGPVVVENGSLLAQYDIELDDTGCLKSSRRLKDGESGKNVWYAYVERNPDGSPWFNGQTYVDTMSKDAIAKFIEITHEVYKDKIGGSFGSVVPCIFTDEPQLATKTQLSYPWGKDDVFLPWTADLPETFKKDCGEDLVENLPEVIWNLPEGRASVTRYHWHDHTCERFVTAFLDQIGAWCKGNGIMLNGHMMEEPSLGSQTTALGEAMRCYRSMEMPGMDLLMDGIEYNTAKQASSVSRQNGTRGTMCEIYGVTHWYFTFEGHKGCGDWQAALGITFRVHHLTWVSMAGEGKRDYPACIGYQSSWYKEYGYVEDHFARVGYAMTRGRALTRVGIIHPIESYWLGFGPSNSGDEQWRREWAFSDLTNWMLYGLVDFDFISESLLPKQVRQKGNGKKLSVGHCEYDVIILPNLRTIRSTTLRILQDFAKAGGKVVIAGNGPQLVDARVPKSSIVIEGSKTVFWSDQMILLAVEEYRDLRVTYDAGSYWGHLLHQIREDGDQRYVFICNTDRNSPVSGTVHLKGLWDIDILDTLSGEERSQKTTQSGGWTSFPHRFEGCASLLLRLSPGSQSTTICLPPAIVYRHDLGTASNLLLESVELSEPNVLMLDYAEFKLNNQDWSGSTEILQIDNILRGHLRLPWKGLSWKQPWSVPEPERAPVANLSLRFTFESAYTIRRSTMLALEDAGDKIIRVNDTIVTPWNGVGPHTWWVDEAIKTVPIPASIIKKGKNIITLDFPFGVLTNLERIYLLGRFAVNLSNRRDTLLQPLHLDTIIWGDITGQGLPFYVGNITYNCRFTLPSNASSSSSETPIALSVPQFSSPVLTVHDSTTKTKLGRIAFQPHQLELGKYKQGTHKIAITAFGNRYNSFGHIHLSNGATTVCEPNMWRTGGDWWDPNYNVKPIGVLECPRILVGSPESVDETVDHISKDWVHVENGVGNINIGPNVAIGSGVVLGDAGKGCRIPLRE